MQNRSRVVFTALGLSGLAVLAVACSGSSSSGTSNTQVTTISGDKQLKDLSLTELQQLVCHDSSSYMESQIGTSVMKSGSCALAAGMSAAMGTSATECKSVYDQCTSSTGTTTSTCSVTTTLPSTCTVTVSQYSSCVSDETAEMKTLYQQLANMGSQLCTNLDAGMPTQSTTTPASCQNLQSLCPGLSAPGSTSA